MKRFIALSSMLFVCLLAQANQLTMESVSEQILQAESLHQKARTVGHGWVITLKLIEQSKAALADDQLIKADELSKRALGTALASVTQSIKEKRVWRSRKPSS